jgi:lipid-binding SYLF domain-containing protein
MSTSWRRWLLRAALVAYLVAMGFMAGVAFERMRFDGVRQAVLDRYNEMIHKARANQMNLERSQTQQ